MNKPPCMVWLPADHRLMGDHGHQMPFLLLGDKYARAVKVGAKAQPVMFPLADTDQIGDLLALVDGVMLTGSPSNVHPSHFAEDVADPSLPLDPTRDLLTLALVQGLRARGRAAAGHLPRFPGDQRGPGRHAAPAGAGGARPDGPPRAQGRAARRAVRARATACVLRRAACSKHGPVAPRRRSIRCTARASTAWPPGLEALAHAPDGVVEAFARAGARTFAYAVQFHPEWRCWETPFYAAIFEAFGRACRSRSSLRLQAADLRAAQRAQAPDSFFPDRSTPTHRRRRHMTATDKKMTFNDLENWLNERRVTEVECLVPDLTGVARGKILPREKFTEDRGMRLPQAIVAHGRDGRVPGERAVLRRDRPDRQGHAAAPGPDHRRASCPGPPTRRRR